MNDLCARLDRDNLETAIAIAKLPQDIRGYGPIKEAAMAAARKRRAELLAMLENRPADLAL